MAWYVRVKSPPELVYEPILQEKKDGWECAHITTNFPVALETDLSDASYPYVANLHIQLYEMYPLDARCYPLGPASDHSWKPGHYAGHTIRINPRFVVQHEGGMILNRREVGLSIVDCMMLHVSVSVQSGCAKMRAGVGSVPGVPNFIDVWTGQYSVRRTPGQNPSILFELENDRPWLQRRLLLPGPEQPGHIVSKSDKRVIDHTTAQGPDIASKMTVEAKPELHLWEDAGESMARHIWYASPTITPSF
jgi:hypothetical protein